MYELQRNKVAPLSVFISYAHEDELLRQQLEAHLSLLRRQGLIADWHDRQILAGQEWARDIDQHLETATIILLLVSSDFLASDYCYDIEMQQALQRHEQREARVIPIILRPCDWQNAHFVHLQALPRDGKPVTEWPNQDAAFRDITQGLRRVITDYTGPVLSPVELHNRAILLKRVRETWINGVLQPSLHQQALIALNLQDQPDALDNPWHLQVQETNSAPHLLPTGTSIMQVYDKADGGLLILGEPGAGKTTLLLELARILLERAEHDRRQRMPVVFHLSSWAEKRRPLSEWLIEELQTKYKISRKIGKTWMSTDQILPLLDGLDEVAGPARPSCVQAINTYCEQHQDHGPLPIVVCCRSTDYQDLSTRVELSRAISIQPLTSEQITSYLQRAGDQLEALRQTLRDDPELYELAQRPLMLSIFTLAYQKATLADLLTTGTHEAKLCQVFTTYVQRMLTRRGALRHGTLEQCKHWLASLAAQMQQHHQTIFYIEHLQPDWLKDRRRRFMYRLTVVLLNVLLGMLLGMLLGTLGGRLLGGLAAGLIIGLVPGLSAGMGDVQRISFRNRVMVSWKGRTRWSFSDALRGVVPFVLMLVRLGAGVLGANGQLVAVVTALWICLLVGLLVVSGLLAVAAGVLLVGLLVELLFGLLGGLVWLLNRLEFKQLDEDNQGIPEGLLGVMLFALLGAVVGGLLGGLGTGLLGAVVGGLLGGLGTGLLTVIIFSQVFTLRFWLSHADSLPWNLVAFLDEAAERLLLRKVGRGYIFVHRLLLDYFASLEKKES